VEHDLKQHPERFEDRGKGRERERGHGGHGGRRCEGYNSGGRRLDTEEEVNKIRGWKECEEVGGAAWVRGDGDVWTKITLLYDIHSKHWRNGNWQWYCAIKRLQY
jgi:hypothetical protein